MPSAILTVGFLYTLKRAPRGVLVSFVVVCDLEGAYWCTSILSPLAAFMMYAYAQ